jgi:ATP/maltotriose-dependent transcriptional regulator MalT
MAGDLGLSSKLNAESLKLFRELGDQRNVAELLHRQAVGALVSGDNERAVQLLDESLSIALSIGSQWGECQVLGSLAHVARSEGDLNRAAELFAQSAAIAVEIGNVWWETNMLGNLAELDLVAGRTDEAEAHAYQALTLGRNQGDRNTMMWELACFARVAAARGDIGRAGMLWGAVEAELVRRPIGGRGEEPDWIELTGPLIAIQDPSFERGRAEGRGLPMEEVVERILANRPTRA